MHEHALKPREDAATRSPIAAPIKSLSRGLEALDLLRELKLLRTTDLALRLSVDKGSASRILQTLARAGYAQRIDDRRYAPGVKLASAAQTPPAARHIRRRARPILIKLVELTGESAHLGVVADDQVLYLDRENPRSVLVVDRPIGTLAPLHCTALGKALLAFGAAPLPTEFELNTAQTVTTAAELAADLRRVVAQGYATDDEELCLGVRCAAAPLMEDNGEVVGAVSLAGPTVRVGQARMHEFGKLIRTVASQFARSHEGGGSTP